jgi:poly(A) polymerase
VSDPATTLERARETINAALGRDAGDLWLVGGSVRDALLGRSLGDWDLVVAGDPEAPARALARRLDAPVFPLSERHGAWRITTSEREIDVQGAPEGIEADLARRDFTVNAIALRLEDGTVRSVPDALVDLDECRLRLVADDGFRDDPLRLLRLVRLATQLDFVVDPATSAVARRDAGLAAEPAGERIRSELEAMLRARDPVDAFRELEELGLLAVVLPEVAGLRGVRQNGYHHLDVLDHTLQVLDAAADIGAHPDGVFGASGVRIARALGEPLDGASDVALAVRWAALLHDIAKPETRAERPNGEAGFPGHAALGAEQADRLLERLRAGGALRRCVAGLVREHLRLGFLVAADPPSARDIHRYRVATAPWEEAALVLSVADRLATRGLRARQRWIRRHQEAACTVAAALAEPIPPPLLRGDDLARELGIAPGPRIGELLGAIAEEQAAGNLTTAADALAYARERMIGDR